jgi:uncharacterized integral membrane protein
MSSLLIAAIIGIGFSLLAIQNTLPVQIHLAGYTWSGVPLFIIAFASLLVGLAIAWFLSLFSWASSSLSLHGKEARANKAENTVSQLEKRILELEAQIDKNEKVHKAEHPSKLHSLTHPIS